LRLRVENRNLQGLFIKIYCEEVTSNPIPSSAIDRTVHGFLLGGNGGPASRLPAPAQWWPWAPPWSSPAPLLPSTKRQAKGTREKRSTSRTHLDRLFKPKRSKRGVSRRGESAVFAEIQTLTKTSARVRFCDENRNKNTGHC
jgi:hypothetical protein